MDWQTIRTQYPDQWVVLKVLASHNEENEHVLDSLSVVQSCANGVEAVLLYGQLRKAHPRQEYCYLHTAREELRFPILSIGVFPRLNATPSTK